MLARDETQTRLTTEMKIVPRWAWACAGIVLVALPFLFSVIMGRQHNAPPAWARPLLGIVASLVLSCYVLLIGYINRDAKRRGMSPVLWTIVAIVIPNGLGIILYFVLRQPLRSACTQCGNPIQAGFSFCPQCSYKLGVSCPRCQRVVGVNDVYCPYCGSSLRGQSPPVLPANQTPTG